MTAFDDYAEWYDLFYEEKDYSGEAAFVTSALRTHGVTGVDLLEIGCGTGAHARWFTAGGWRVTGLDRSERMLAQARDRLASAGLPVEADFVKGDARDFNLGRKFDAVVSLFHVMSYQAGPGELMAAMKAARRHLDAGGVFLFDFWYGPAVLAQKPERRVRLVEDARFRVRRTASPSVHEAEQVVRVRYVFEVTDKRTGACEQVEEIHPMRYVMPNEIKEISSAAGLVPVALRAWMSDSAPDDSTWSAFALLRADL
jgi:SAM-dependent methyltransferase